MHHRRANHVYKVLGTTFYQKKKRRKKKETGVSATIQINAGIHVTLALCLNSGQLCHGRQFREWHWTAGFWDQKVSYCYSNGFLFHFLFFFLIFWANWGLLNLQFGIWRFYRREATTCSTQERGRKRYVPWLDIYESSLFFFWFCRNWSCLMRVFAQRFFFKQCRTLNSGICLALVPFSQF